jgi:hypothetical protein
VLTPVSEIVDTGVGLNLIRETVLPEDWERYRIPGLPAFHIVGAGYRRLMQKGNITYTVQLGTLKVKARFIAVQGLAAECILGCQFIDRQEQVTLPREKRVTLANVSVIPILQDSDPHPVAGQPKPPKELPPSTKVRVAKMILLPPRSECVVPVQCAAPGLRFLQTRLRDNATAVLMVNSVAEILPNRPLTIRVVNKSMKIRRLPKGTVLGHALPHPTAMVALIEDPDVSEDPPEVMMNTPDKNYLRWSMGFRGIRRHYAIAPISMGILGRRPCNWPLTNGRSCRDTRHARKTSLDVEWETRSGAFDSAPDLYTPGTKPGALSAISSRTQGTGPGLS